MVSTETRLMDARERLTQLDFAKREAKEAYKMAMRAYNEQQAEIYELERCWRMEQLQATDIADAMDQIKAIVEDTCEDVKAQLDPKTWARG
tara:strand:- start:1172 stop:1444 length:273 start_codon:yes stop_codon:yes gene_type:complete